LVALVFVGSLARAQEQAPPDVLKGERYDGRKPQRSAKPYLLAVPRMLLLPPRLLVLGIGYGLKPLLEWNERQHVAERVIGVLTSEDGLVGVRPVFNFELGYQPSFGVLYFNDRHDAQIRVSTAIGGPETILESVHARAPLVSERLALHFDASYRRRDDELFTGIGIRKDAPFGRYEVNQVDTGATLRARPMRSLDIDVGVAFGLRRFANGGAYGDRPIAEVYCARLIDGRCLGVVDDELAPGFNDGTQFVRPSVAIHIDSRHGETSAGILVDAGAQYTHGLGGDTSSYLRLHGHVGTAFEIWRHRSLYVGVSLDDMVQFGSTPIPFSELVVLGGPDDLRGFQRGRFRDSSSMLASIEYRWPIWMWMDGSLFFDYGGVFAPEFRDFHVGDLRPDIGLGFRVHTSSKYVMRIQAAYGFGSEGGLRVVIAGNGNPS
jgi:hypothetical protein